MGRAENVSFDPFDVRRDGRGEDGLAAGGRVPRLARPQGLGTNSDRTETCGTCGGIPESSKNPVQYSDLQCLQEQQEEKPIQWSVSSQFLLFMVPFAFRCAFRCALPRPESSRTSEQHRWGLHVRFFSYKTVSRLENTLQVKVQLKYLQVFSTLMRSLYIFA